MESRRIIRGMLSLVRTVPSVEGALREHGSEQEGLRL